MFPLKDDIPARGFPVVTALLIAGTVGAYLVAQRTTGVSLHGTLTDARLLPLGLSLVFLWLFGNSVEDAMGRGRFLLLVLAAGLLALAVQRLVPTPGAVVVTLAVAGAVAGVLGAHVSLYPRAGVVTGVFIPFLVTLVELPAAGFVVAWFVAQLGLGLLEVGDPSASAGLGATAAALAGGFLVGLVLIRVTATRPVPQAEADVARLRRA